MARQDDAAATDDTQLKEDALAYAIELYRELSQENGAPTLGTQNQVVDFILGASDLRDYVRDWASSSERDETALDPPRRLPRDPAYERIRAYMRGIMETPPFIAREREGR